MSDVALLLLMIGLGIYVGRALYRSPSISLRSRRWPVPPSPADRR